jgi:hypothetical protein
LVREEKGSICTVCGMHHALCTMQHALCTMHHALCSMHHTACPMQHALCTTSNFYTHVTCGVLVLPSWSIPHAQTACHGTYLPPSLHSPVVTQRCSGSGHSRSFCTEYTCFHWAHAAASRERRVQVQVWAHTMGTCRACRRACVVAMG